MIVASARDVDAAVHEIREWGKSRWAVAVMPLVTKDIPADHPDARSDLARRRRARPADRASQLHLDAALFPRLFDLWDNIFLGRLASHPWGAMRFIASVIGGGIMDRYPNLRVGTLECGFGWLPFWGRRMDEQYAYVGSTAQAEDEAERIPVERPVFLQRRAPRGRRHVRRGHAASSATTC